MNRSSAVDILSKRLFYELYFYEVLQFIFVLHAAHLLVS